MNKYLSSLAAKGRALKDALKEKYTFWRVAHGSETVYRQEELTDRLPPHFNPRLAADCSGEEGGDEAFLAGMGIIAICYAAAENKSLISISETEVKNPLLAGCFFVTISSLLIYCAVYGYLKSRGKLPK